jgi:hypothetical protein
VDAGVFLRVLSSPRPKHVRIPSASRFCPQSNGAALRPRPVSGASLPQPHLPWAAPGWHLGFQENLWGTSADSARRPRTGGTACEGVSRARKIGTPGCGRKEGSSGGRVASSGIRAQAVSQRSGRRLSPTWPAAKMARDPAATDCKLSWARDRSPLWYRPGMPFRRGLPSPRTVTGRGSPSTRTVRAGCAFLPRFILDRVARRRGWPRTPPWDSAGGRSDNSCASTWTQWSYECCAQSVGPALSSLEGSSTDSG